MARGAGSSLLSLLGLELKILIVEDNERNRRLFKLVIDSIGHKIVTAENGEDGIKIAKRERPDLILIDIHLPMMDGLTAFSILRSNEDTKDIPVIAVTSHAMKGDREHFLQQGFADYIAKPIDVDDFIKTLDAVSKRRPEHK